MNLSLCLISHTHSQTSLGMRLAQVAWLHQRCLCVLPPLDIPPEHRKEPLDFVREACIENTKQKVGPGLYSSDSIDC